MKSHVFSNHSSTEALKLAELFNNLLKSEASRDPLLNRPSPLKEPLSLKSLDFSKVRFPAVRESTARRASCWKPSLRPLKHKFTETMSPSVFKQPACSFKQTLTSELVESLTADQIELACGEHDLSRHFERVEVPTNFQSLVAEEPDSSLHAEYRASEFTGAELPSVESRCVLRDEVPTNLRSLVAVEPDSYMLSFTQINLPEL